ncbi:hypothetical protein M5K25_009632 [Dendrobium thyrsiflorum]|uniref:Uncharacterized protein n=1 Tax=Dendrobium thyrsiflorum TaxID=117978 RepID=A0ABD0V5Y1_DENTH
MTYQKRKKKKSEKRKEIAPLFQYGRSESAQSTNFPRLLNGEKTEFFTNPVRRRNALQKRLNPPPVELLQSLFLPLRPCSLLKPRLPSLSSMSPQPSSASPIQNPFRKPPSWATLQQSTASMAPPPEAYPPVHPRSHERHLPSPQSPSLFPRKQQKSLPSPKALQHHISQNIHRCNSRNNSPESPAEFSVASRPRRLNAPRRRRRRRLCDITKDEQWKQRIPCSAALLCTRSFSQPISGAESVNVAAKNPPEIPERSIFFLAFSSICKYRFRGSGITVRSMTGAGSWGFNSCSRKPTAAAVDQNLTNCIELNPSQAACCTARARQRP